MANPKDDYLKKLEHATYLTRDDASQKLLEEIEKELVAEKAQKIRQMEETLKIEGQDIAKDILADAMKHGATGYVAEYTISTVRLPDDEIKGRVIGREGRNIRAFEQATGVEIEMD